jgi:hypothetical protein
MQDRAKVQHAAQSQAPIEKDMPAQLLFADL